MSLKPFTYPFPETRFLHTGLNVYKFKIRYGNSIRREEIENKEVVIRQLEDSIRVVLGNMDNLQPFVTEHFIIFPYKSQWESVSHLKFKHGELVLAPYPFVFTLYVEMKWFHENPPPGKPGSDSALGLVGAERKWAGAMRRKRSHMEVSGTPMPSSGLESSRVKAEMSSQYPSKRKTPMKSRRNRERRTHQEWPKTPALESADVPEQGSKSGDSLAEKTAPLPQLDSPPPPSDPPELGPTGFFGFLSSLFPFRYFFRKDSQ